jgi:hypothetical protein
MRFNFNASEFQPEQHFGRKAGEYAINYTLISEPNPGWMVNSCQNILEHVLQRPSVKAQSFSI